MEVNTRAKVGLVTKRTFSCPWGEFFGDTLTQILVKR